MIRPDGRFKGLVVQLNRLVQTVGQSGKSGPEMRPVETKLVEL